MLDYIFKMKKFPRSEYTLRYHMTIAKKSMLHVQLAYCEYICLFSLCCPVLKYQSEPYASHQIPQGRLRQSSLGKRNRSK